MKINRLYTVPEAIDPIDFKEGLNLILGEKDESSDKRNGVGKSLCIEFINFALLKRKADSRVARIPKEVFPPETFVCLDFEIAGLTYTIKRSVAESEQPILIENNNQIEFTKLEDATQYLTEKLFAHSDTLYPSFRVMLGPLIRDERSEFKSLVKCYDTERRVPDDYTAHLYLLGIEISLYEEIKNHIKEIDELTNDIKRIKENVHLLRQKDIDDARSDLNELNDEVSSIEASIEKLENIKGFDLIKDEIIELESEIDLRRRKKTILKQQLSKLKSVSQKVEIDPDEISEFYEQLKEGLGTLIAKDLTEVMSFKQRIDDFQNKLLHSRRDSLSKEVVEINNELSSLDKRYAENLAVLDQQGELKNLKQTYTAFKEKSDQFSQLRSFVDRYDYLESEKLRIRSEKEVSLLKLQSQIQSQKKVIDDFEKTILGIHEYIQGNKQASFQIKHSIKKQVVEITMRIDSDGSHSVEREKVFIYDIALLLNHYTRERHPGFLIHDNIFDVDQDTLVKSILFLENKSDFGNSQYILTLNSDRLEFEGNARLEDLDSFVRARFTKTSRFLKKKYQETL
ncbi:MAG: DUF2326 domain-containing protein [Rickettsiales bacterium]